MNTFVDAAIDTPDSYTENGARTFSSSLSACVDLFFRIAASRGREHEVDRIFNKAIKENVGLAVRIALWARDVRQGAGEREVFRHLIKSLPRQAQLAIIPKIIELGRWDDLSSLVVSNDPLVSATAAQYWKRGVLSGNGLAAKWAPRKGLLAVKLRTLWAMSPKEYRKTIVSQTNVVEQQMCAQQWDEIEFAHVPSVAAARYNAAFGRNARDRYIEYKQSLVRGETKINASAIFPHDVVRSVTNGVGVDTDIVDVQWMSLPDFCNGNASDILVMSDVSGSMGIQVSGTTRAIDISVALGLYISERQTGPFKDLVLTFSSNPTFHKVDGSGICERIANLSKAEWGMSTDVHKAFKLILDTATANNVPQSDMPKVLAIISDMEFDVCGKNTNMQAARQLYEQAGYSLPRVVFWNVGSRTNNIPVRYNTDGVALVSGFSPAILKSILAADQFSPQQIMLDAVMIPRYEVPGVT